MTCGAEPAKPQPRVRISFFADVSHAGHLVLRSRPETGSADDGSMNAGYTQVRYDIDLVSTLADRSGFEDFDCLHVDLPKFFRLGPSLRALSHSGSHSGYGRGAFRRVSDLPEH
jgi:hypothetical protein